MAELVAELARRLVDEPDAVRVEEIEEDDGTIVLRLHVAEDDIGKVIGRQGRLARALRTIVRAGGVEAGRRLQLEIADQMPSVAALYDIHGNLAALDAVLAEVPDDATIVVGGDICAGGEQPSETLARLRGLCDRVAWVRGNADRELHPKEEGLAPPEFLEQARSQLSEEEIEFLHELPPTQRIGDVLYCHASPRNDLDIFTERTPEERIAFLFDGLDVPTVVCGHSHTQFERTLGGVRVVNAGSVGMPYEEEPGAYWLLDLVHRRTPYDGAELTATREEAVSEFTERGL